MEKGFSLIENQTGFTYKGEFDPQMLKNLTVGTLSFLEKVKEKIVTSEDGSKTFSIEVIGDLESASVLQHSDVFNTFVWKSYKKKNKVDKVKEKVTIFTHYTYEFFLIPSRNKVEVIPYSERNGNQNWCKNPEILKPLFNVYLIDLIGNEANYIKDYKPQKEEQLEGNPNE